ncbi:MAG: sigma-70 family RNA polymerase sigma factor [Planctomycetota bacterium]
MEDIRSLVIKARSGDVEAYGHIVRQFQDMAYGFAYSMLGDFHLAEDAAQEAFIAAYECLGQLREPGAFAGWFRKVLFKHCERALRKRKMSAHSLTGAVEISAGDACPAGAAEKREIKEKVLKAIGELPERQRMVTMLFYINGYSQKDIAEFLEVPVTTVKKRLSDSRNRLKERVIDMVEETLKENVPDERFSQKVIRELLDRPRPLKIEGHPIKQVWDQIQAVLADYEVIKGEEVEEKAAFEAEYGYPCGAYHLGRDKILRTQTTSTIWQAMKGREVPVRLLTAGRVFRPEKEDEMHLKVFHQVDGLCIDDKSNLETPGRIIDSVLGAILGHVELRVDSADYGFVDSGFDLKVKWAGKWIGLVGGGTLKPETLREAGYDADMVGGLAFGMGLERIAMLKFGIDDIRKLWQPPYLAGKAGL